MPEAHRDHAGLPALYGAEVSGVRWRWMLNVVASGPEVVAGPDDLGPVDAFASAGPGDPGRYLLDLEGQRVPVPPREAAVRALEGRGFTVAAEAGADARTDHGWTQVATALWTAPCRPAA